MREQSGLMGQTEYGSGTWSRFGGLRWRCDERSEGTAGGGGDGWQKPLVWDTLHRPVADRCVSQACCPMMVCVDAVVCFVEGIEEAEERDMSVPVGVAVLVGALLQGVVLEDVN